MMGAVLIALGLLAICGLSLSHVPHIKCFKDFMPDQDFPGNDLKPVYIAVDEDHCQLICTEHPLCQFFTFVRTDFNRKKKHYYCYLKHSNSGHPTPVALKGVTSGYSLKNCAVKPVFQPAERYMNLNFWGADYDSLFTPDSVACQRACTKDLFCQFFTFAGPKRYKCHLKKRFTVLMIPNINARKGIVSGFSHKMEMHPPTLGNVPNAPACEDHLFPNTEIQGIDVKGPDLRPLKLKAACPGHCLALCSDHPRCSFFSFNSADNRCYLKEIKEPKELIFKQNDKVTSGLPARFCRQDDCWIKEAKEDLDFPGYDLKIEVTDDAEDCQKKCTGNPECQFYSFIKPRKPKHKGTCYQKRIVTIPTLVRIGQEKGVESGFSLKKSVCLTNQS